MPTSLARKSAPTSARKSAPTSAIREFSRMFCDFFAVFQRFFAVFWPAKLCQNAFQTIPDRKTNRRFLFLFFEFFSRIVFGFSWFSADFGGARDFWTWKSARASNFASDTPLLRSVRPEIAKKWLVPGAFRDFWLVVRCFRRNFLTKKTFFTAQ